MDIRTNVGCPFIVPVTGMRYAFEHGSIPDLYENNKHPTQRVGCLLFGAGDRNRTGMVLPPRDFKSLASADFATPTGF